jgi:hypothetical protein
VQQPVGAICSDAPTSFRVCGTGTLYREAKVSFFLPARSSELMPNESKSTNDIHRSEGMIFESSEGSATAAAATVLDDILCSCPAYPIFCSSCRLLPVENTKSRSAKSPLDKKAAAEVLRITSNRPQPSYLFSQDINTISPLLHCQTSSSTHHCLNCTARYPRYPRRCQHRASFKSTLCSEFLASRNSEDIKARTPWDPSRPSAGFQ